MHSNHLHELERRATELADTPALTWCEDGAWSTWSYRALWSAVLRCAGGLSDRGVGRSSRVSLLFSPNPSFLVTMLALLHLGAVCVLVSPQGGLLQLLRNLRRAKIDTVIAPRPLLALSWLLLPWLPHIERRIAVSGGTFPWLSAAPVPEAGLAPVDAESEAMVVFTTGTTGPPKMVPLTHGNLAGQHAALAGQLGSHPGLTEVCCFLPSMMVSLSLGHHVVFPSFDLSAPALAAEGVIVEALKATGAAQLTGSPPLLATLADYGSAHPGSLPQLRRLLTFGAPIRPTLQRRIAAALPQVQLSVIYGATEGLPLAVQAEPAQTAAQTEDGAGVCLGPPSRGVSIVLKPLSPPAPDLPTGLGQIGVSGPQVVGAGVHWTGDLGYLDAEGRLWGCGREKDRHLHPDGSTWLPTCIEGVLEAVDGVRRCAVVPRGEGLVAVVEPEPSWQGGDAALRLAVLAKAAGHPRCTLVNAALCLQDFPVDSRHNYKVQRDQLQRWAAGQRLAEEGA